MKDHGPHISKTAVDDAVDSFLQKMRQQGVGGPSGGGAALRDVLQFREGLFLLVRSWLPQSSA